MRSITTGTLLRPWWKNAAKLGYVVPPEYWWPHKGNRKLSMRMKNGIWMPQKKAGREEVLSGSTTQPSQSHISFRSRRIPNQCAPRGGAALHWSATEATLTSSRYHLYSVLVRPAAAILTFGVENTARKSEEAGDPVRLCGFFASSASSV